MNCLRPMEEIYLACQKEFDTWDKIMKNHKPHLHPWLLPVELKINKKLIPKDIYNNIIIFIIVSILFIYKFSFYSL